MRCALLIFAAWLRCCAMSLAKSASIMQKVTSGDLASAEVGFVKRLKSAKVQS